MKLLLLVLLPLINTISASAQIERKPVDIKTGSAIAIYDENTVDKQSRKDRLKDLDLTKEQLSKLKEIREANKPAKDAIENNTQLSETERKKQLHALQKDQAQKVQAILTKEQIAKFKAGIQNNP
jgi:Spy/CpxP family protein refolding chaperone